MSVVPSLSEGSHGDVSVLMVTHLLRDLSSSVQHLDQVLQVGLELLSISQNILSTDQGVRGAEAGGDLLLGVHEARVELLQRSRVLSKVSDEDRKMNIVRGNRILVT